ncbi:hypothetical protein BDI4_590009 [Burkholderia diffusa]|nr:hypothetical protein BDI4_590009 [Burkholderia diffusa]
MRPLPVAPTPPPKQYNAANWKPEADFYVKTGAYDVTSFR